jgi:predicted ribosomally synthesized peptide with SipW-like signal peptide
MKKRWILSVLIVVLAVAAVGGATMAWFTDQSEPVDNVFTAGTVIITATETEVSDQSVLDNMNPGDCVEKEFTIINEGTKGIHLRAKFTAKWVLGHNSPTGADLSDWLTNYNVTLEMINATDGSNWQFIAYDPNDEIYDATEYEGEWIVTTDEDGTTEIWYSAYYFLKGDVDGTFEESVPSDRTVQFRVKVCFDGELTDNDYQGALFTLSTVFDSIQRSNDASVDAWGVKYVNGQWVVQ